MEKQKPQKADAKSNIKPWQIPQEMPWEIFHSNSQRGRKLWGGWNASCCDLMTHVPVLSFSLSTLKIPSYDVMYRYHLLLRSFLPWKKLTKKLIFWQMLLVSLVKRVAFYFDKSYCVLSQLACGYCVCTAEITWLIRVTFLWLKPTTHHLAGDIQMDVASHSPTIALLRLELTLCSCQDWK